MACLAGCASPTERWQQAGRSEREIRADLRACERDAETETLAARGETRGTYGANRTDLGQNRSGESPMQLADRSDAAKDFAKAVRRCMTAQGYSDADR